MVKFKNSFNHDLLVDLLNSPSQLDKLWLNESSNIVQFKYFEVMGAKLWLNLTQWTMFKDLALYARFLAFMVTSCLEDSIISSPNLSHQV